MMKKYKKQTSLFREAMANVQLLLMYLLHYRRADAFFSRQNINSIL